MNKFRRPDFKTAIFAFALLLISFTPVFSDTGLSGYSAILNENVVDLRAGKQMPVKSGNSPGGVQSPEDLEIGSIFLTVDQEARKVVDIYEYNGKTVIETIKPRPEEVFLSLYVPDYDVDVTRDNAKVSAMQDGVTLLPPGAGKADMLSSDFTPPSERDKSVTWLETDPVIEAYSDGDPRKIFSFNVDIPIWKKDVSGDVIEGLKDKVEKAKKDNNTSSGGGDSDGDSDGDSGGSPSLEIGAAGEVRLKGTLRVADCELTGGFKMPSMSVVWVHDWWIVYHPEFHFTDGYARANVSTGQQFDFRLTGTVSLSAELKIPLAEIIVVEPDTSLTARVGFYAKIGVEGQISITAEVSEYTRISTGGECKLVWPFIPVKFTGNDDSYFNFAFRPIIAAEAEIKAGLYLGAGLEIAGMTLVGAEAGGGTYLSAEGYMEPLSIMGCDTEIGFYGNFNEWIIDISAEAGMYIEGSVEILTIGIPLFEKKWPFWEWHQSWEI